MDNPMEGLLNDDLEACVPEVTVDINGLPVKFYHPLTGWFSCDLDCASHDSILARALKRKEHVWTSNPLRRLEYTSSTDSGTMDGLQ